MVDKTILRMLRDDYGIRGAELSRVRSGLQNIETELNRPLILEDNLDNERIRRCLAEFGNEKAQLSLSRDVKIYGNQLVWESEHTKGDGNSNNRERQLSGRSIQGKSFWGRHERNEGD